MMQIEYSPPIDVDRFVELRRDFHAHPELAGLEKGTSQIIAKLLAEWGYRGHGGLPHLPCP